MTKYIRIGSMVDVVGYDEGVYDSAIETDQPIKAGAPIDDNDVVIKSSLSATGLSVTSIVNPTELNSKAGVAGDLILCVQVNGAGVQDFFTLYGYDDNGPGVNVPYVVDAAGAGSERWIAIMGYFTNQSAYIDGNLVFVDSGGNGLPYAEINISDGAAAQTIATGAGYTKSTAFASDGEYNGCTADSANDKITTITAGRYRANVTINFEIDTANTRVDFAVFVDGAIQDNMKCYLECAAATTEYTMSMSGFIDVAAAKDVDLRVRHDDAGNVDVTIINANLNITQVGGS